MKKNNLYVLMLTLAVSLVGLLLVGCDDTVVEPPQAVPDWVDGSVEGIVVNALTKQGVPGIWVHYTSSNAGVDTSFSIPRHDSVLTDNQGYFLIAGPLSTGFYTLTFTGFNYSTYRTDVYIPTLEELKGDIDVNPSGRYPFRFSFTSAIPMYPLAATVTGRVFTALPEGSSRKEKNTPDALQEPVLPAGNVEVVLTFPSNTSLVPLEYREFTNDSGVYRFTHLPTYKGHVYLSILPFTSGDSSYKQIDTTILMGEASETQVPDIYGIVDCRSIPTVLSRNFLADTRFHYDSSLTLYFSQPMDTVTFEYELQITGSSVPVQTTRMWSMNETKLIINPVLTLLPDTEYKLVINHAESRSGCQLSDAFRMMSFTTVEGIQLQYTNLERAPMLFDMFPIDNNIEFTFNMPPVIDPLYGSLSLTDITDGDSFPVAFTNSVDGNMLVISPENPLERSHTYRVCYGVLSDIPGDFQDSCFTFQTEIDTTVPSQVTGWALDMPAGWRADWNTTEITFKWNTDPAVAGYGYKIYAKDNNRNTDFIEIMSVPSQDYLQQQSATVVLPEQFDYYLDDDIQTPFSGGTIIEFAIRAYNAAGMGPFSNRIPIKDETPPGAGNNLDGGNNGIMFVQYHGSADNTTGTEEDTVWLVLTDSLEYMQLQNNPVFNFIEGGGDENYSLPNSAGHWEWNNTGRKEQPLRAWFTIPAGRCAAGDYLEMAFYDNSGNDTTLMIRLAPYLEYGSPEAGDSVEAPGYTLSFTVVQPPVASDMELSDNEVRLIDMVDYFLTLDGTTNFIDTIPDFQSIPTLSSSIGVVDLDDTWFSDNLARIALRDTAGGCFWYSDNFTIVGLNFVDIAAIQSWDDSTVYDRRNNDSTAIPLAWNDVGLDSVTIWYTDGDSASNWIMDVTIPNTGSYDWYPPSLGHDYRTWIKISDYDTDNRPEVHTQTGIDITFDFVRKH